MDEWARVEPEHGVTMCPVSYRATFVDMARAVVDDNIRRGLHPDDYRPITLRIEEAIRFKPQRMSDIHKLLGTEHTTVIRRQVEDIVWDFIQAGKLRMDPESVMHWIE
jgi:hypothetical protein